MPGWQNSRWEQQHLVHFKHFVFRWSVQLWRTSCVEVQASFKGWYHVHVGIEWCMIKKKKWSHAGEKYEHIYGWKISGFHCELWLHYPPWVIKPFCWSHKFLRRTWSQVGFTVLYRLQNINRCHIVWVSLYGEFVTYTSCKTQYTPSCTTKPRLIQTKPADVWRH